MHLEHLHSWQGGQGGSGLMHAVMLITAATEAADQNNAHGAQLRVALITVCRGAGQPVSIGLEPLNLLLGVVNDGVNSLDVATQLTDDAGLSGVDAQGGQCVKATVAAHRHSDANQQKRLPTNPFLRAPETMAVTTKTLIAA